MPLSVSNMGGQRVSHKTCVMCRVKHVLQFNEHQKLVKCSKITLNMFRASQTNKNKYWFMIHNQCLFALDGKSFPFRVTHVSVDEP